MATKETVKLTNVLFGEKTFSAIEQNVGADADSLGEVINGNKNIDVVTSNDKLLIGVDSDNAAAGTVLTALGDGTSTWAAIPGGGSGPVTGIIIDGTELVADSEGKVTIPIGSVTNFGVLKGAAGYGTTVVNGEIRVNPAGTSNIDARGTSKPIASPNLNYAVTAALTDANHIVLTPEQQATAKEVLGIGKFELIETIDLLSLGDVTQITRTQETDGTAYNFSSVIITITLGFATVSGTAVLSGEKDMYIPFEQPASQGVQTGARTDIVAENRNGAYINYSYSATDWETSMGSGEYTSVEKRIDVPITISTSNINKIVINLSLSGTHYNGDTIKIYGVRA